MIKPDSIARIGERVVIASVSGGKDSTAMCLALKEAGVPFRPVFLDTGWEHEDTYRYLKEYLPQFIGPITFVTPATKVRPEAISAVEKLEKMLGRESAMIRLVLHKKMFPSKRRRFCTQQLKVFAMRDFLETLEDEPVNTTGVRRSESQARSKLPEWEDWKVADIEQWRPIIDWSDDDIVDIHTRHGVMPNPLYLKGAERVGCYPCIYARKAEIKNVADQSPERMELLTEMERILSDWAGAPRSWFQSKLKEKDGTTTSWPLHKVIQWSRTSRGGFQFELFSAPKHEWGCMRWGVCDTGGDQ